MKAVIPAAGLGTRFYPISRAVPKEMLPILNVPMIDFAIKEARDSGIEEIAIITSSTKTMIEEYYPELTHIRRGIRQNEHGTRQTQRNFITNPRGGVIK